MASSPLARSAIVLKSILTKHSSVSKMAYLRRYSFVGRTTRDLPVSPSQSLQVASAVSYESDEGRRPARYLFFSTAERLSYANLRACHFTAANKPMKERGVSH